MASNPAMALAFSAAFAALTSPSALASIGMQPPPGPLQPPSLTPEQLQHMQRTRDFLQQQQQRQQPMIGQLHPMFPPPMTYMPFLVRSFYLAL